MSMSSIKDLSNTLWEMFMGPGSVPPSAEVDSVTATTTVEQPVTWYGASTSYSARDDPSVSTVAKADYDWYQWSHSPTVNLAHLSNAFQEDYAAGSAFSPSSLGYIDMAPKYDDDFDGFPAYPYDVTQDSRYQHKFWAEHCPEPETLFVRRSARIAARRNQSYDASISPRGSISFT